MRNHQLDSLSIEDLPPCKGGVSRRGFCAVAGAGLVTLGLSACDPGGARVAVGGLGTDNGDGNGDGNGNGGGQDAGTTGGKDSGTTGGKDSGTTGGQDSGTVGNCSGSLNAGPASAIAVGQVKHFTDNFNYDLFVCRDAGGLYAINGSCPHAGCTVTKKTTEWYCNCHGATFDLNGQKPTSPAHSSLAHYAVCIDGSGNVIVDYTKTVVATTRV